MFLADKYGGLDTPEKRAAVGKWVMWANASLDPICFVENDRGQVSLEAQKFDVGARLIYCNSKVAYCLMVCVLFCFDTYCAYFFAC